MLEEKFECFLQQLGRTDKAIASHLSRGRRAEKILGKSFDYIVSDDKETYEALCLLQNFENPSHNPMQNSLRLYYQMKNGKEFPRKRDF